MSGIFPSRAMTTRGRAAVAICLAIAAIGCNRGDGISRYRVSGSVTFQGRPVPAGMVYFNPDVKAGNDGPPGFAAIVDGRYDTGAKGGRHAIAGPHQVVIEGHEPGASGGQEETSGRPLFGGYSVPLDLPAAASQHDFVVPAEAAKKIAR